jgi:hypothetical protein
MRFVDALVKFGQRVAHVREAVHLSAQGVFQIFASQNVKLFEHPIHPALIDGIELVRRCRDGREADFMEAQIVLQMPEDPNHIGNT